MPIVIEQEEAFIWIRFSGVITNEDLQLLAESAERIEAQYDVVPSRITLLDSTTALHIDFHALGAFAKRRRRLHFPNAFKSAIVAREIVHFGAARMFQTLNDHPQVRIAIFPEADQALTWLKVPNLELPAIPWAP